MTSDPPAVRLDRVSRAFGEVRALDDVSLEIGDGEFFALLGPSGSGKTTCLRVIAGFDRPSSGSIELNGAPAAELPPYERDVNTVFQDYALFPHMTVGDNVGYGLRVKRVLRAERERRVAEALELVRLPDVAGRKPAQLSGGQRQRVALARAIVNRPRLLLLDEPLGALDLKLRQQMQVELKELQQRLGISFVHVTHDQEEALAMSDRLAVFREGRVEQVGTPAEVYEHPATAFVADFVGSSNLFVGDVARSLTGSEAAFSVRPERMQLVEPQKLPEPGALVLDGRVHDVVYLGAHSRFHVETDLGPLVTIVEQNRVGGAAVTHAARDRRVRVVWQRADNRPLREGA